MDEGKQHLRPMLGTCDFLAKGLRVMPAVTEGLDFCGLIRKTAQLLSPLRSSKGHRGPL